MKPAPPILTKRGEIAPQQAPQSVSVHQPLLPFQVPLPVTLPSPDMPLSSQRAKQSKKSKPAVKILFNKYNFPTIYQAYNIKREKRIKKSKKRTNRLIKRFNIDLIHISKKIDEEMKKQSRAVSSHSVYLAKTGRTAAINKRKKVSKMRKAVERIKAITKGDFSRAEEGVSDNTDVKHSGFEPQPEDRTAYDQLTNDPQLQARKKLNNTPAVKMSHDRNFEVREYVDNILTTDLDYQILKFINHLNFSQLLKKKRNPLKFRKRLVFGFNEVLKTLQVRETQKLNNQSLKIGYCRR